MPIITLISDFGFKDHYVSALKGAILKQLPEVTLVDISHQVEKYDLQSAAYLLKAAYANFPDGTIHIIGVKSEFDMSKGYVIVEKNNHVFIGADNGIFSLLFDEIPIKVTEFFINRDLNLSFVAKDIFVPIACKIASGVTIDTLGKPKTDLIQRMPFRATLTGDVIKGAIVYIDDYENVITNIHKSLFEQAGETRAFVIHLLKGNSIDHISREYSDVGEGDILALFNAEGYLEIAMRDGNIASLLHLKLNDQITVHIE